MALLPNLDKLIMSLEETKARHKFYNLGIITLRKEKEDKVETAGEHLKCERDIYKETIEKWGVQSQLDMAVEEIGELLQKLIHYKRGRCDEIAVAEEIADVMLMAEEMAYLFGREHVIHWLEIKKEVVSRRLEEEMFRPSKEVIGDFNNENLHAKTS